MTSRTLAKLASYNYLTPENRSKLERQMNFLKRQKLGNQGRMRTIHMILQKPTKEVK